MYFYKPVVLPDRHIPISYHSLPLFSSKGVNTKAVEARATPFHWRASSNMAATFFSADFSSSVVRMMGRGKALWDTLRCGPPLGMTEVGNFHCDTWL